MDCDRTRRRGGISYQPSGGLARRPIGARDPGGTLYRPEFIMNMSLSLAPIVSLIAGILILVVPRLLNYIVAIYLIIVGLLGLFPQLAG